MVIIRGVMVLVLFAWFIIATVGALGMPPMEYKWQAWAIVACGPVAVFAGVWEICSRVFKK